jgi:hypothetical protein
MHAHILTYFDNESVIHNLAWSCIDSEWTDRKGIRIKRWTISSISSSHSFLIIMWTCEWGLSKTKDTGRVEHSTSELPSFRFFDGDSNNTFESFERGAERSVSLYICEECEVGEGFGVASIKAWISLYHKSNNKNQKLFKWNLTASFLNSEWLFSRIAMQRLPTFCGNLVNTATIPTLVVDWKKSCEQYSVNILS